MIINNIVSTGPAAKIPAHLSFGQFLIDKLRENCENEDPVVLINGDNGRKTTCRKILQETVNVASGLKKLGVKRGDTVALFCENRDEFIIGALASICCGATVTTINVGYTKDEIIHVFSISKPSILLCSESTARNIPAVIKSTRSLKKIIQLNGRPVESGILSYNEIIVETDVVSYEPAEVQGWTDTLFILYSSGTTGLPKGVMLTNINALCAVSTFNPSNPQEANYKTMLSIVPWYHAYGLMSTINYILLKRTLVYFSGFNPQTYLNAIQEYKVDFLVAVPPIVVFLAKSPIVAEYDLSSVNVVWCGAAPLSVGTINEALKRMPNCSGIFQGYGLTEASLAATKDLDDPNAVRKSGSAGYPIPGVKAKVVDIMTRQKLGPNQEGEICIKGPVVMKGYAGDEKASRDTMDDEGYLKTGDIGYYDSDGCFFIVDRLKELIKYKGHQVAPAFVEGVILQHSGVAECGVVGAPDESVGELPTAFVVPKPGVKLTEEELIRFTNERLSKSSRLHGGVIFLNEIPKNPSGKILRRALRLKLQDRKMSKL